MPHTFIILRLLRKGIKGWDDNKLRSSTMKWILYTNQLLPKGKFMTWQLSTSLLTSIILILGHVCSFFSKKPISIYSANKRLSRRRQSEAKAWREKTHKSEIKEDFLEATTFNSQKLIFLRPNKTAHK
jgi:hypothetical protein